MNTKMEKGGQRNNQATINPYLISVHLRTSPMDISNIWYDYENNRDINEDKNMSMNKNRIKLTENELKQIVAESVKKVLKESYNDSQTVSKIRDLRPKITSFIEYLEDKYGELGSGNDFLDRVYNSAYKLESDLQSFLRDDYKQQIYQY